MKRTFAIVAAIAALTGMFFLGVWAQYVHDQPLIHQGRQARAKTEAERTHLTEAKERAQAATRRAHAMQAEAKRQQIQLTQAMNKLQDAYDALPEAGSLSDSPSGGPPTPSDGFQAGPTALCWDGT